jgi:hypothetical protein
MAQAKCGSRSTKTKTTTKTRTAQQTDRQKLELPVKVRFNQDLMLYAIDGTLQVPIAAGLFALMRAGLTRLRKRGEEWLVFGGTVPHHWRGLTTWLAISPSAHEALGEHLQQSLKYPFEAVEFCRPARVPELQPISRVSDDGLEFFRGAPVPPRWMLADDDGMEYQPFTTERDWVRED